MTEEQVRQRLRNIWVEVFERDPPSDDFFENDGDSLDATMITTGIYEEFGVEIDPSLLLDNPSFDALLSILIDSSVLS